MAAPLTTNGFVGFITKGGPVILSAGGVAAVIWLAVEVVPEERKMAQTERAEARKLYVETLDKVRDTGKLNVEAILERAHGDHLEIIKRLDEMKVQLEKK
jgi:hypothetical protein